MIELTPRERDVLTTILAGHTTDKEIARHLINSIGTVQTHLLNLFAKTGTRNKTKLVLWAWRNGWQLEHQQ